MLYKSLGIMERIWSEKYIQKQYVTSQIEESKKNIVCKKFHNSLIATSKYK